MDNFHDLDLNDCYGQNTQNTKSSKTLEKLIRNSAYGYVASVSTLTPKSDTDSQPENQPDAPNS